MNYRLLSIMVLSFFSLLESKPTVHVAMPGQEGIAAHFIDTGLYGLPIGAKGLRLLLGMPECKACRPNGFFSMIDLDAYVGESPFWIGLHGLGGGFGLHRHVEYRNATPDTDGLVALRHHEVVREKIVSIICNPIWRMGLTFDGRAGGIDTSVGCAPHKVLMNGGLVPTAHVQLLLQSYGYTPTLSAKKVNARLFAGGQACITTLGKNSEWGVSIAPGQLLEGMVGMQAAIAALKLGVSYGYRQKSSSRVVMNSDYVSRVSEYKTAHQTMIDPFVVDGAIGRYFISSYVAFVWDNLTLGISGQTEWALRGGKVTQLLSIAIGCTL